MGYEIHNGVLCANEVLGPNHIAWEKYAIHLATRDIYMACISLNKEEDVTVDKNNVDGDGI